MARSGQASIEVLADFSKFARTFQRDLNAAISGVSIDMSSVSNQIAQGVRTGVNNANRELNRLGNQTGETFNIVTQQSQSASTALATSFINAGKKMSSVGDTMTTSLTLPIAAVGTATVMAAGNFEKSMNKVKALSGATSDEFNALREEAIELGSTTQYSASEAADALGYLSMAGFDATESLDSLPGVLNLAAAGSIELAEAADIASNILSGYGLSADKIGDVNDVLAKTFTSTNTTLSSLGETFKYVGPVGASAGVSFEELSAAIGLLGNAGIQGSSAGTALRTSIVRLLKPTKQVTKTLDKLDISVTDSHGDLLPLVDIVKKLEESGASTADMMAIFGLEAGPAMQALVSQGSDALGDLTTELENAGGTADRIAKTQMEGLNGSIAGLKSAAEGLMIAIGDSGLLGWMTSLTKSLTGLVSSMSSASPTMLKIATIAGIVIAAIGPFLAIFGRMATAIGNGILAFKKFGAWIVRVAPWLATLSGPIGWAIAALVALGVALVVVYKKSEKFRKIVDATFRAIATASIYMWKNAIVPAFNWIVAKTKTLGVAIAKLWVQAQPVFAAFGAAVSKIWNTAIKPAIGQIVSSFASAGPAILSFWSEYAKPAISSIISLLGRLAGAIKNWWSGNGDTVMRTAAAVVTWLGSVMTTVWSGIMGALKMVASVITWVIVNVAIPAFKIFAEVVKTIIKVIIALKPVWLVIGAVIAVAVMTIIATVKVLWSILSVAFTAIATIVKWLWTTIIVPAFKGIVLAIRVAAAVITWLWGVAQPIFNAIAMVVKASAAVLFTVFNAIVTAIRAVASVVAALWSVFSPIFSAIGKLIWSIWSGVASVVFSLFKLGFTALATGVKTFWSVLSVAFTAVGRVILTVWSSVIRPALSLLGSAFSKLWNKIRPVVSAISAVFKRLWSSVISPVVRAISSAFSRLGGIASRIFGTIVGVVRRAIAAIVAAASGVSKFVSSITNHFKRVVSAIKDKIKSAVSTVKELPGKIKSALGNLGSLLYNAGKKMIKGLIKGMTSQISAVKEKASSIASSVADFFPHSPAKEGPLSGSGDPTISGGKIVTRVASGMADKIPALKTEIDNVVGTLSANINSAAMADPARSLSTLRPVMASAGTSIATIPQVTYQITVNALDPRGASTSVIEAIKNWERHNGKGWRS